MGMEDHKADVKKEMIFIKSGLQAGVQSGLGDRLAEYFHNIGMDSYAQQYSEITGKDCGCEKRQQILNKLFPW